MGTKWANPTLVLDQGPNYIYAAAATTNKVVLHVIKAYSNGDSYATVVGNSVGNVTLTQADVPVTTDGSSARVLTVASKSISSASASSGALPNLELAIVDSVGSTVLLVTDETSDQVITAGNPITTPSWTYTAAQPT